MKRSMWPKQSRSICASSTMCGIIPVLRGCGIQYVKEVGIAWLVLGVIVRGLVVLIINLRGISPTKGDNT